MSKTVRVKIIKDTWMPSRSWYIVDAKDNKKIHTEGFKTKKKAKEMVESIVGVELQE
jgi:hypothetical protein|tara:strand:+ start:341 stop:511 length:171 start_codon:yes stop_codon:yes gene_type:complete